MKLVYNSDQTMCQTHAHFLQHVHGYAQASKHCICYHMYMYVFYVSHTSRLIHFQKSGCDFNIVYKNLLKHNTIFFPLIFGSDRKFINFTGMMLMILDMSFFRGYIKQSNTVQMVDVLVQGEN